MMLLGLHILHGWHTHDSCKKKRRIKTSTEILEARAWMLRSVCWLLSPPMILFPEPWNFLGGSWFFSYILDPLPFSRNFGGQNGHFARFPQSNPRILRSPHARSWVNKKSARIHGRTTKTRGTWLNHSVLRLNMTETSPLWKSDPSHQNPPPKKKKRIWGFYGFACLLQEMQFFWEPPEKSWHKQRWRQKSWSKCLVPRPKEKTKPKAMKANNAMEKWTEAMVNVEDAKKQEKMANERRFAYRCALETSAQTTRADGAVIFSNRCWSDPLRQKVSSKHLRYYPVGLIKNIFEVHVPEVLLLQLSSYVWKFLGRVCSWMRWDDQDFVVNWKLMLRLTGVSVEGIYSLKSRHWTQHLLSGVSYGESPPQNLGEDRPNLKSWST